MKIFHSILLLSLIVCMSCEEPLTKEELLERKFNQLAQAFKADDPSQLREFCREIMPDTDALRYMQGNDICYRGMPCQMDENMIETMDLSERPYSKLLRVRGHLLSESLIEGLTHLDSTNYHIESIAVGNKSISAVEPYVKLKSGNKVISYPIGELLFIKDDWFLFTMPNVNYSVKED